MGIIFPPPHCRIKYFNKFIDTRIASGNETTFLGGNVTDGTITTILLGKGVGDGSPQGLLDSFYQWLDDPFDIPEVSIITFCGNSKIS